MPPRIEDLRCIVVRSHQLHTWVRGEPNLASRALFAELPRHYDRLAAVLSLAQDRRWRREMIDHVTEVAPGSVLDVATGPAGVALQLAARTNAAVTGIDLSEPMLRRGKHNVAVAAHQHRVALVLGRGEQLPFPDAAFDALTFTYLLRYVADPRQTMAELARVVHPGGVVASLEFAVPPSRFWWAWWWLYTRVALPLAGGLLGGRPWFAVGRFLGPNISAHYRRWPVPAMVQAWADAGITDIGMRRMSLGGGLVMWGRRGS
jgi:demethylmenaquinone methyltransferase / 2-methoxy-6-polyprenyl-1,4-benzoquinol methylase